MLVKGAPGNYWYFAVKFCAWVSKCLLSLVSSKSKHLCTSMLYKSLRWRHNGHDSVSNHQPRDCFLNRLFRHRSKKTSKLRVTGLCVGKSPVPGEFPAQMANNAENVSIWWRHHVCTIPADTPRKNNEISDTTSDDKVGIMSTCGFQWSSLFLIIFRCLIV